MAVALKRFGDVNAAKGIMASIKERSVSDEEMGMFWRDLELSWWWYRAPIETQAMMIEAFDEVMNDKDAVEDCKVWLLKQKQTQDWKTTKATADAVYALLLRGSDLLASDALVEVSLGGETIKPDDVEAGTGFYEQRFGRGEIQPELGQVTVTKIDEGVAWGSLHWQYLEDMSKITPYEGTPLKLTKQLYVKKNTAKGPTLEPVDGAIEVGDELVVRIVLRSDRDMEYVHLKDYRGSGTEPVNVLVAVQVSRRAGVLRIDTRHGQPLLHRLPAQGDVRLRVLDAGAIARRISNRNRQHPVHVRARVQQPQRKSADRGEVIGTAGR